MRNRALIAHWVYEHASGAVELVQVRHPEPKTYLKIHDYARLRSLFADLLAELQRIKSEGDYEAAKLLVETYGIHVDPVLHEEICRRYAALEIAPYKGFINPRMEPVLDHEGKITDVRLDYTERYDEQMLRYSKEYGFLI
jgi:dipeptidyl-peptidase-3